MIAVVLFSFRKEGATKRIGCWGGLVVVVDVGLRGVGVVVALFFCVKV